jgi:hypothetical protein
MKRNTALKILNPVLLVLFINQALSGLFHSKYSYEAFELLHETAGKIFIGLLVLHIILNFNWIKANYLKKKTKL